MNRPPEILSLGAGVQSTALFILGCEGEVVPKLDGAIFADTRWEPRHVMEHLKNLQQYGAEHGVPVYLASRGSLPEDVVNPQVYATIPAWTQTAEYEQVPTRWGICPTCNGEAVLHHSDTDELCEDCNGQGSVPVEWERRHVRSPKGRVKRQCTPKYKIEVIQRPGATHPRRRRMARGLPLLQRNRPARRPVGARPRRPRVRRVPRNRTAQASRVRPQGLVRQPVDRLLD